MRRTEEEFKREVLERSDKYIKMRKAQRKKLATAFLAAAAVCIVAAGVWKIGINGSGKMNNSVGDGYMQGSGMADNSVNEEAAGLTQENLNDKSADIISVEVRVQEGEKVVSRCYSNSEKVSQMTAAIQEMETIKRQQEKLTAEIEKEINRLQEEMEKYQGENAGGESSEPSEEQSRQNEDKNDIGKQYSITVIREDGEVKSYEIADINGTYYELQYKIELTQQYIDRLQSLVDTMMTD